MIDQQQEPRQGAFGDFSLSRRKVLLGLGMAAASGTAFARMPTPNRPPIKDDKFESFIPNVVGPWQFVTESGVVLPPQDALSDRLYDDLVTRVYADGAGRTVMFLIAYNNRQDGVLQIHRPEICYPAGGYQLSPTRDVDLPIGGNRVLPANAFLASGRDRDEAVLYWTRVGTDFPRRWSSQRLSVIRANLQGIVPDGLLVRASTFGSDMTTELAVLKSFMAELIGAASPDLRAVLLGSAVA
jgi:EpsI family protein